MPEESPAPQTGTTASDDSSESGFAMAVAFLILFFVMAGATYKTLPPMQHFLDRYWAWVLLGAFVLVIGLVSVPSVRHHMRAASVNTRVGLTIIGLGLLMALVCCVILLPAKYQVTALRAVFLVPACLFPATLYYLFISTRKYGLFNEFIVNLDRLGLLQNRPRAPHCVTGEGGSEATAGRQLRLRTYVQKFEAVYGSLPTKLVETVLETEDPRQALVRQKWSTTPPALSSVFNQGSTAPLVLSTVLVSLGWFLVLPPIPSVPVDPTKTVELWTTSMQPNATPAYFAFLGAYFFSIQMLFRRYIRRDLRGAAYSAVTMRILLAVIGTWVCSIAIEPMLSATRMSVLAFAIGFFPPVAWQIVRSALKKVTFAPKLLPSLEQQLPLSDLDGLNVWHQTRLEEEDVESIPNMATADLVDLFLNTRIPPDRIIDWVDQAILYMHLPPEQEVKKQYRAALHAQGIRTASALMYAYERSHCQKDTDRFERIIPASSVISRAPIRSLVMALFTNPNLCLIQAWRGTASTSERIAQLGADVSAASPTVITPMATHQDAVVGALS